MVDKVALGRDFSKYCGLPLAVFYQLFFMFIYHRRYIILVSGNIVK